MPRVPTSRARRQRLWSASVLLWFLLPQTAGSTNDMRPITVMVVARMCLAQEPQLRDGTYGRALSSRSSFPGWKEFDRRPLTQCLQKRKWVPVEACKSLDSTDITDPEEFDAWWYGHLDTLQRLEPVFDYFDQASRDPATSCPDITLAKEASPQPPGITIERAELIWAGEYEGKVDIVPDVRLVRSTDRISAAVGVHFGMYFTLVSTPDRGILTVRYKISIPAPGVLDRYSNKRTRVIRDQPQCVLGRPCLVGFVFNSEDEIVPGKWQLKVSFHGKTLLEHEFDIVRGDKEELVSTTR